MISQVSFNNPDLQSVAEKAGVGSRTKRLDSVSGDIKTLEACLQEDQVKTKIVYRLGSSGYRTTDEMGLQMGDCALTEEIEHLTWDKGVSETWRVMYLKVRKHGHFSDAFGPIFEDKDDQVVEHRPLIETSATIRLRCEADLPGFLKAIAKAEGVDVNDVEKEGDIPF